jgi:pathogenesis-related protein 1
VTERERSDTFRAMARLFWVSALFAVVCVAGCSSDDEGADGGQGSGASAARGGTSSSSGGAGGRGGSSASGGSGNSGSCTEPSELAGITAMHNQVRSGVDTETPLPPLEWSCEIAAVAQAYADELADRGCPLEHPTAADAVDAWAAEERCYTYGAFPNTCTGTCSSCGHYTQIVWRESAGLGCGHASCGDEQVWVCNYDPPGNYLGERPY